MLQNQQNFSAPPTALSSQRPPPQKKEKKLRYFVILSPVYTLYISLPPDNEGSFLLRNDHNFVKKYRVWQFGKTVIFNTRAYVDEQRH